MVARFLLMTWHIIPRLLEVGHIVSMKRLIQHYLVLLVLHLYLSLIETELLKELQLLLLTEILIQ